MEIVIDEQDIMVAAQKGFEAFVNLFAERTLDAVGGQLTQDSMSQLSADQITLLAYHIFRTEVMEGGFIQLIHNGYGPFIFLNPFAKAMRLWGARDFCNLVYDGRRLYEQYGEALTADMSDDEFMALYEQYEAFDDLDDRFIEMEEEVTGRVANYIDGHIELFAELRR